MSQSKGSKLENKFGQGLITEAHGLNFPENAATDCGDVVFTNSLSVTRRQGFDNEDSFAFRAVPVPGYITSFQWKNVGGISAYNFTVIQIGRNLFVHDNSNLHSLSTGWKTTIDLNTFKQAGAPGMETGKCQFASGRGDLFVTHPYMDPIRLTYDPGTNSFSTTNIVLYIRDFYGVDDLLAVDTRPPQTPVEARHYYNLLNQGWDTTAPVGTSKDNIGGQGRVFDAFSTGMNAQPSNADIWWVSKDALNQFNYKMVNSKYPGNTPAPRGHFKLRAFDYDRQQVSGITSPDLPTLSATWHRPSAVAFFAGRCWYAGTNYNAAGVNYASKIYFTRIIEQDSHLNQCYQDGDPTTEDGADLLPSDGGVIDILEIGTVYKLFPMGYSLLVFANNGIWSISGSTGTGFTAKDYSIAKIGSVGLTNDQTFVDIDGSPVWWSQQGIQTLGAAGNDSGTGTGTTVQSLTDSTIKTYYRSLSGACVSGVTGTHDRYNNTIVWTYNPGADGTVTSGYTHTTALTLNLVTKAFSKWTVPQVDGHISMCLTAQRSDSVGVLKFLYLTSTAYTFQEVRRTDYLDYGTTAYTSFVESGYSISGNGYAKFYSPYIFVYIKGTQGAQVRAFTKWDFANVPDYNKWTIGEVIYARVGQDYTTVRKKVRGSGHANLVRFESVDNTPFELVGWAALVAVNGSP